MRGHIRCKSLGKNMTKYDPLDLKIISILQTDGRRSFAEIARELSLPAGVVQARYAKMKKSGLIKGTTLILDQSKLGILYHAGFQIIVVESQADVVAKYIENLKVENASIITWVVFGHYNVGVFVLLKDLNEVFKIKEMIRRHPAVINVEMVFTKDLHLDYPKLDLEGILEE